MSRGLGDVYKRQVLLEAPARAFRQEKETKSNHFENVKLYVSRVIDDRIL